MFDQLVTSVTYLGILPGPSWRGSDSFGLIGRRVGFLLASTAGSQALLRVRSPSAQATPRPPRLPGGGARQQPFAKLPGDCSWQRATNDVEPWWPRVPMHRHHLGGLVKTQS